MLIPPTIKAGFCDGNPRQGYFPRSRGIFYLQNPAKRPLRAKRSSASPSDHPYERLSAEVLCVCFERCKTILVRDLGMFDTHLCMVISIVAGLFLNSGYNHRHGDLVAKGPRSRPFLSV